MPTDQSTEEFLNSLEDDPAEKSSDHQTQDSRRHGMTQSQRFILAILFFFLVLTVGIFVLLITNRIALPI